MKIPRVLRAVRNLLSPSMVVALLALTVAMGGTAYAAVVITGANVKDGSLRSADIADGRHGVQSRDVKNGSLGVIDLSAAARARLKGNAGATGATGRSPMTSSASATYSTTPVVLNAPTAVLRIGNSSQGGTGKISLASTGRITVSASINMSELSLATGRVECVLQIDDGAGTFATISQIAAYKWTAQATGDSFQVPLTGATVKSPGTYDVQALCDDPFSNSARFNRGDLTVITTES